MITRRPIVRPASAVAALILFAFAACPVARAQPLTDRLPAGTMVYLGWSPSAAMQTTAAARMLADERIVTPWRRLFQELALGLPDSPEGERISDHLPALLADAAQCEGCFALLELRQAKGKNRFNPQSVLMLDLGAKRKSFEEHFAPVQARLKERMGDRLQMMKIQRSWVYFRPDREGKPRVTWGFVGDTFVMYFGDGAEEFIPRMAKGALDKPLRADPAFADAVGKVPGESSVFTTYLDTKAALTVSRVLLGREANADFATLLGNWDALLAEFGLANVKGVAEKTVIEDRQFVTRTLVRLDGAPKGLLALAAGGAVDDAILRAVPADAMAVAAARLDLAKFYDQIKSSVVNVVGADAKQGFDQLEQGAAAVGLPLQSVLGPIGDQWVIYNAQSHGGFAVTGWTLVGSIREPEKFAKVIGTVRALVTRGMGEGGRAPRIHSTKVEGATIEHVEAARWDFPFPVAWAVVGDRFVIGLYPQVVEDAVRQIVRPERSILDNADFVAARKRTGGAGPVAYMSGPDVVTNLYPIGLVVMQFVTNMGGFGGGGGDDGEHANAADLVPSMRRLMDYVGHDAVGVRATPDGLLKTRTVANPLLSPLAWVDSPVVWLAIGIPSLTAADEVADRVKSATNLRQVGQAMMLFANENKENYPPDLATLTKTQDLPEDALKSPYGPAKDGRDVAYVHFAGLTSKTAAPDLIVAYDAAALEQGEGTNALYGDGHVDWLEPGAFKKALDESRKKAALQNAAP